MSRNRAISSEAAPRARPTHEIADLTERSTRLAQVHVVWWRDIPAQVIAGKGRRAAKRPLPERFEQAIDRCAMKVGAKDADAYLAEWRRGEPYTIEGADDAVADAEAARLDAEYGADRIKALIARDGWNDTAD